jgi:hypothetical protein
MLAECRIEGLSSRTEMRLTDLSLHGGYVDANVQCRSGDRVELTITLDGQPVTLIGRVAHIQPTIGFGFAIEPESMTGDVQVLLARYLEGVQA